MTLVELKKSLHKKIDKLNDPGYLEMLDARIDQKDEVFIIPEHMKEGIEQGKEDIQETNQIPIQTAIYHQKENLSR